MTYLPSSSHRFGFRIGFLKSPIFLFRKLSVFRKNAEIFLKIEFFRKRIVIFLDCLYFQENLLIFP